METLILILIILIALPTLIVSVKILQLLVGRRSVAQERSRINWTSPGTLEAVPSLELLPLVDMKTDHPDLKVEPGVSYLVKTGDRTILLDVGFNKSKEHPSPLLHNMEKLGVKLSSIDMIFFSHLHLDHVGGMKESKSGTFSLSQGNTTLPQVPVYAPEPVTGSAFNPTAPALILTEPTILTKGIGTTGAVPRYLFIQGRTLEQSLVVNVKEKGLVVIVGCGHQTIERILDDVARLYDEKIYGVIGGLHYPVHGGRLMAGPLNLQALAGSDRMPWHSITEEDVERAIVAMKSHGVEYVALSAHDSSDWAMERFRQAFGEACHELKVGAPLTV